MSFNDVKNLRKEGKIQEALALALQNIEQDANNIWNKRALGWVYYDFSKKYAQENNVDLFLETIQKIKDLQLPKEEKMIFDNLIWSYNTLFRHIYTQKNINYSVAKKMKESLSGLHFSCPSENFSMLINALHKTFKDEDNYASLAENSFFRYLRSEDFLPTEYNGRKIMPLAEQIYTNYCKALVKGEVLYLVESSSFLHREYKPNKEKISAFLSTLDKIIEDYPDYTFLPYFKAKMEIILGGEKALQTFIPFAKKKRNDYWVWQLMSEIVKNENETEKEFACLCKALTLKTPENFLGKIRILLAEKLIAKQLFNEAKTEIDFVIDEKIKNQQKIPSQIMQWQQQEWYKNAQRLSSNFKIYNQHKNLAESILYEDIEEEVIVVQNMNLDKKMISFIKNKQKYGFFKYEGFLKNPKVGDILKVRLEDKENAYFKLISARSENNLSSDCVKFFEGVIKIAPQGFGFVEDIFIPTDQIQKNNIQNLQKIDGKAILTFEKKKNKWGWKGFITKHNNEEEKFMNQ